MGELKVGDLSITHEEVSAYNKAVYEYTVNPNFSFVMKMTETQEDTLREFLIKRLDDRDKQWECDLHSHIAQRLTRRYPKDAKFQLGWLQEEIKCIKAIAEKLTERMELDKYEPPQKTIAESTQELNNPEE